VFRRSSAALPTAPLFSFASPTAYDGYAAYAGLPATDGCKVASTVTGTKGEALTFTRATTRFCPADTNETSGTMCASGEVCLQSRGISIYRAGTNLALRSEQFDNVPVWANSASVPTRTADFATAPDGTATADRIQFNATGIGVSGPIAQNAAAPVGSATCSVWAKENSTSVGALPMIINLGGGSFACASCAITTTGWKRCAVSGTVASSGNFIIGNESTAGVCFGALSALDVLLWGAQCEASTYATPYVATTSAAVTRNAEDAQFTLGSTLASTYSNAATVASVVGAVNARYTGTLCYSTCGSVYNDSYDNAGTWKLETNTNTTNDGTTSGKTRFSTYYTAAGKLGGCSGASKPATTCAAEVTTTVQSGPYDSIRVGIYSAGNGNIDTVAGDLCVDTDSTRCR
jgi:hypothetical protein